MGMIQFSVFVNDVNVVTLFDKRIVVASGIFPLDSILPLDEFKFCN